MMFLLFIFALGLGGFLGTILGEKKAKVDLIMQALDKDAKEATIWLTTENPGLQYNTPEDISILELSLFLSRLHREETA